MAKLNVWLARDGGGPAYPVRPISRIEIRDDEGFTTAVVYMPDSPGGPVLTIETIEPVRVVPNPEPGIEPD